MGGGDEDDVVAAAWQRAALEVGQSQGPVHLAVVVLDAPAKFHKSSQLPHGPVLDGELVVWSEARLSFEALQRRASAGGRTIEQLATALPPAAPPRSAGYIRRPVTLRA
ncbi:hypothetical protein [Streptomyces flavidovirens]|uniref:Uncharacterized protein n=1 Tax=Streptomyces flavidovirens TaxID=67298 RepID=A0ABW6RIM3_9ACTN